MSVGRNLEQRRSDSRQASRLRVSGVLRTAVSTRMIDIDYKIYNARHYEKPCSLPRKLANCSPMHNLLTVKETAKYLRIPLPTVYYLVQRGQFPAIQIGGRWRIKKASLDKDILKEDKSGQPTVLVVDDDESLQTLFKVFLKKIGFSRVVVGTVKEALDRAREAALRFAFPRFEIAGWPRGRRLCRRQGDRSGPADRDHHRLSRQRNARSDSGKRPGHGLEEAARKSSNSSRPSASSGTKTRPSWPA